MQERLRIEKLVKTTMGPRPPTGRSTGHSFPLFLVYSGSLVNRAGLGYTEYYNPGSKFTVLKLDFGPEIGGNFASPLGAILGPKAAPPHWQALASDF